MRPPRQHVAAWVLDERTRYADVKYAEDGDNRAALIKAMEDGDWERWTNFLGNYIKRAELFGLDTLSGRQALGKAIVTGLHFLETAVQVHGPMPRPGKPSGEVEPWNV